MNMLIKRHINNYCNFKKISNDVNYSDFLFLSYQFLQKEKIIFKLTYDIPFYNLLI